MEDVGIFYGHLSILQPFGIIYVHLVYFVVIWYIFPSLVCKEKSGNPVMKQNNNANNNSSMQKTLHTQGDQILKPWTVFKLWSTFLCIADSL
jgi:hypothetical protein